MSTPQFPHGKREQYPVDNVNELIQKQTTLAKRTVDTVEGNI